jgi:hypothetical protein
MSGRRDVPSVPSPEWDGERDVYALPPAASSGSPGGARFPAPARGIVLTPLERYPARRTSVNTTIPSAIMPSMLRVNA